MKYLMLLGDDDEIPDVTVIMMKYLMLL